MFKVNDTKLNWRKNFSILELLEEINDNEEILPLKGNAQIITVNNEILSSLEKNDYIIKKYDAIRIIPLAGGG